MNDSKFLGFTNVFIMMNCSQVKTFVAVCDLNTVLANVTKPLQNIINWDVVFSRYHMLPNKDAHIKTEDNY